MVRLPRYLTAMIALAVAGGAPLAPARALVQPACVPCQYAGSEVIKIDWYKKKKPGKPAEGPITVTASH